MVKKIYTQQAIIDFLQKQENTKRIKGVKVTSVKAFGFNQMEGTEYQTNLKVMLIEGGYRLIPIYSNSNYHDETPTVETEQEYWETVWYSAFDANTPTLDEIFEDDEFFEEVENELRGEPIEEGMELNNQECEGTAVLTVTDKATGETVTLPEPGNKPNYTSYSDDYRRLVYHSRYQGVVSVTETLMEVDTKGGLGWVVAQVTIDGNSYNSLQSLRHVLTHCNEYKEQEAFIC